MITLVFWKGGEVVRMKGNIAELLEFLRASCPGGKISEVFKTP